jgi:3-hydroxyacyl-CoA dehydrogenase
LARKSPRHAAPALPLVRNLPCKHPQGDAYFQFARNMVAGMAKNFPRRQVRGRRGRRQEVRRRLAKEREIFMR